MDTILLLPLASGLLGIAVAHWKQRNKVVWFFVCGVFSILGLIVLLFLPKLKDGETSNISSENGGSNKKSISPKLLGFIGIIGIAVIAALVLEQKKSDLAVQTKTELLLLCNGDDVCKGKISDKFDVCVGKHISVKKTGKLSRETLLDTEALKTCVGL